MTASDQRAWTVSPSREAVLPFGSPIRAEKLGLLYFPIPKNANTSLKSFLYEVTWASAFRDDHPDRSIHRYFGPIQPFDEAAISGAAHLEPFVVLRDPVRRLLSAYANRVVHHRLMVRERGTPEALRARGLPEVPEPDVFFKELNIYRALSATVALHSERTTHFAGHDLSRFAHVHKVEEHAAMHAFLCDRSGASAIPFRRLQTGGPKVEISDLSLAARRVLEAYLEPDLALLAAVYPQTRLDLVGSAFSRITQGAWRSVFGFGR